jgi:DNA/RNA-binding domain of Phe-tRNA-synthetase-like protein
MKKLILIIALTSCSIQNKTSKDLRTLQTIKQLQNLYSWNQFYQDRKMKPEMKKCQSDIHALKLVINELKSKKK